MARKPLPPLAMAPAGSTASVFTCDCMAPMSADRRQGDSMARLRTSTAEAMSSAAAWGSSKRATSSSLHTSDTPPTNCCCTSLRATAITWCTAVALACTAASRALDSGGWYVRSASAASLSCSSEMLWRWSPRSLKLGSTTSAMAASSSRSHSAATAATPSLSVRTCLRERTAADHLATSRAVVHPSGMSALSWSGSRLSTAPRTSALWSAAEGTSHLRLRLHSTAARTASAATALRAVS
mmetsp:Transcript_20567/g.55410  ORF Transcript_20567/g.55410 Transcript_20567/m.55410 type:complete len:240 (-) Transcript_20567:414-1133(-)